MAPLQARSRTRAATPALAKMISTLAFGVAVLGAATPGRAAADEPFEAVAKDDAQQRLIERIRDVQSRDGPFSPELIDPFTTLADLYRNEGDPELAAAAIERALQLVRVNQGLFSLDQVPLLRESLAVEDSSGNAAGVQTLEHELALLARRNPDDLRTVPVLRELGDRRMLLRQRLLAGELPAPVRIGGGMFDERDPGFGSRSARGLAIASEAWAYYAEAIRRLVGQKAYTHEELDELELALVRISYSYGYYGAGRHSLQRQLSYDAVRHEPLLTRIEALVRVADWDLMFNQNGMALTTYEEIYALLEKEAFRAEDVDPIFSPKIPIVLPSFLPNPLDTEEAGSTGYIDVSFDIHKYGSSRDVEVIDATSNVTDADKNALVTLIWRSDFRPRVTNGEFERTSPVVLRYFLHATPDAGG